MKTIKFFTYAVFVLFLGVAISSCTGDDGADGADGIAGTAGADGNDGNDGNANVQTYVFNNPTWGSASWMDINMGGILTADVIDNDVVLGYVNPLAGSVSSVQIPGVIPFDVVGEKQLTPYMFYGGTYRIISFEFDGSQTPNANLGTIESVMIIIIESTTTTSTSGNGKSASTLKQEIFTELKNAGIDINDYKDVCNYYGINP